MSQQPIKPKSFVPPAVLLSLNDMSQHKRDSLPSTWGNPERELIKKINHLAQLLNCTEEEATHHFLHHL